jgi:hypothetical protein
MIRNLNVTHIFVGSGASYGWIQDNKWRAQLFLGNPNFELVKEIGNAFLFRALYNNESTVFTENFDHDLWYENGWVVWSYGKGQGNATDAETSHSGKCLQIMARCIADPMNWEYGYLASRSIFVINNSDVTFSFCLDATEGFHKKDTFAVLLSNVYRNQTLIIATPNGVYTDYSLAAILDKPEGFFSFDLTKMWLQNYNSSIPTELILEFMNYDSDGIQNVAHVTNVTVTSTP